MALFLITCRLANLVFHSYLFHLVNSDFPCLLCSSNFDSLAGSIFCIDMHCSDRFDTISFFLSSVASALANTPFEVF